MLIVHPRAQAQSSINESVTFGATYHVTPSGVATNAGTSSAVGVPLYRALELARSHPFGTNVKILVYPGIHRQYTPPTNANNHLHVAHQDFLENNLDTFATTAHPGLLVIEGTSAAGDVIISGADEWIGGWTASGSNYYRPWTANWGPTGFNTPYTDPPTLTSSQSSLLKRRELVSFQGKMLEQRLTVGELIPGTFCVDEATDRLYIQPPAGSNMNTAKVEVGMRKVLLDIRRKNKLVVRNLVLQHAAAYISETGGGFSPAVNIGGFGEFRPSQFLMENCQIRFNGAQGLGGLAQYYTIRNVDCNDNGLNGMNIGGWHGLIENSEARRNNWKGWRLDYGGDTVGGIKAGLQYHVKYSNMDISDNYTKGLWFDVGCKDITIDGCKFNRNASDGLYFELFRGPGVVRNSEISFNRSLGIMTNIASSLTFTNNVIDGNGTSQINIANGTDRTGSYDDAETGETGLWSSINTTNYRFENNTMIGRSTRHNIYDSTGPNWNSFLSSLKSSGNTYTSSAIRPFLGATGEAGKYTEWRALAGSGGAPLDPAAGSTLSLPGLTALSAGASKIEAQSWYGAGGSTLNNLLTEARYVANFPEARYYPLSTAYPGGLAPMSGARLRGTLTAPVAGTYRFYISSSTASELRISTDATPANATKVAEVTTESTFANRPKFLEFDQQAGQTGTRTFTAGQKVYFEAITAVDSNNGTGSHLAIAWQKPGSDTTLGLARELISGDAIAALDSVGASPTANCLLREFWDDLSGVPNPPVSELLSNERYPDRPSGLTYQTNFEGPKDMGFRGGARWRGTITAPLTGSYTFWISSEGQSEFWLSTDSTSANLVKRANVPSYTGFKDWLKTSSQKSIPISLNAGQAYFVEVLHRYDSTAAHLEVGWARPGQSISVPSEVVPAAVLKPYQPQRIRIITPDGGEVLVAGGSTVARWQSEGVTGNVDIDFTSNNGSTWTPLLTNSLNDASQAVTLPNVTSTQCKLRVRTTSGGTISGISFATFSLQPAKITVSAPTAGQSFVVSSSQSTFWSSFGINGNVDLQISSNNGSSWSDLVLSTANDGQQTLTLPSTTSSQCMIRVRGNSGAVSGQSAVFSIVSIPPPGVVTETFTGYGTNISNGTVPTGTGFLGTWRASNDSGLSYPIQTGSLLVPGFLSNGNRVVTSGSGWTSLIADLNTSSTGPLLAWRDASANVGKDGTSIYLSILHKMNGGTAFLQLLRDGDVDTNFSTEVGKWDGGTETKVRNFIGGFAGTGVNVASGNTALIVMKFTFLAGYDNLQVWVNPSPLSPEPAPNLTRTACGDLSFDRIALRCGTAGKEWDEIRISGQWSEVVPLTSSGGVITFRSANNLAANGAGDLSTPANDGVENLLKYAFNMIGSGVGQAESINVPNTNVLAVGGYAGLPRVGRDASGKLTVTYVRRQADSVSGIGYAVDFSNSVGTWSVNQSAIETADAIDPIFERVTVTDTSTSLKRFGRVRVTTL